MSLEETIRTAATPGETTQTPPGLAERIGRVFKMRETGLVLIITVLFVVMSFASPYFLTWDNIRAMAMAFAVEGIVVVGMTILLISGGIDLSVGSVTALAMVIAGLLFLAGVDPWVASLVAIAACAAIGAAMGFFVTKVGLHHFIVSLAAMVIARGACLLGTGGRPLGLYTLPPEFKFIGQGSIGAIPVVIVIFVVVVVAFDYMLRRTTMFRKVFYTGSNERAAAYSGIRTKKVLFLTTTLCSALCGVAGVIYTDIVGGDLVTTAPTATTTSAGECRLTGAGVTVATFNLLGATPGRRTVAVGRPGRASRPGRSGCPKRWRPWRPPVSVSRHCRRSTAPRPGPWLTATRPSGACTRPPATPRTR